MERIIAYNDRIRTSNDRVVQVGLDSNALLFIQATGITDSSYINAIDYLCYKLKQYSLWTKMLALYPFIGGTATTHKYNLKDSRDLDIAFRLVFNGTITHSINGIQGDGSTGYIDTGFNPTTQSMNINDAGLSIYSRTNSDGLYADMGCRIISPGSAFRFLIRSFNTFSSSIFENSGYSVSNNSSSGLFTTSRTASNISKIFKNGNQIGSTSTSSTTTNINFNMYILAQNNGGSPANYSPRQYSFVAIHTGLTNAEVLNLYNIVQQYQKLLNRQV